VLRGELLDLDCGSSGEKKGGGEFHCCVVVL
jgi:hypothetical protein